MTKAQFLKACKRPLYGITKFIGSHHPEFLVRLRYLMRFHKRLNLENPQNLNEKILYLSLRTDTAEWTRLSDKYQVRDFVGERGLDGLLVQLYGVWENADDVDFDKLPDSFVLKSNNGSGDCILVRDKAALDVESVRKQLARMLKTTYGEMEGGIHYMRIPHKIIAEEMLFNDTVSQSFSTSIIDYKVWCFNGKAHFIWACCNRSKEDSIDVMTYDRNWNAHPEYSVSTPHYRIGRVIPKPGNLEGLLSAAETLAQGFPVVRVDLYDIGGRIYFGEMTFTSLGGMMNFYTDDFLLMCGGLIDLNA